MLSINSLYLAFEPALGVLPMKHTPTYTRHLRDFFVVRLRDGGYIGRKKAARDTPRPAGCDLIVTYGSSNRNEFFLPRTFFSSSPIGPIYPEFRLFSVVHILLKSRTRFVRLF